MSEDSCTPETFGYFDDARGFRAPFFEESVLVGVGSILGVQPIANAANRRPVHRQGAGRVGARTIIGLNCVIYAGTFIGQDCRFGDFVGVREDCRIGSRCVIGSFCDIQWGCLIGNDVRIFNQTQIAGGSVIGDGTFIGPGVQSANHRRVDLDNYDNPPEGRCAPIIGSRVMIGAGALLKPGITIGDGAVIAMGALVTRDVLPGQFIIGPPGRPMERLAGLIESDADRAEIEAALEHFA